MFPAITVDRRHIYRWRCVTTDRPKKTSTSELTSYLYTNATSLLLILNKTTDQLKKVNPSIICRDEVSDYSGNFSFLVTSI